MKVTHNPWQPMVQPPDTYTLELNENEVLAILIAQYSTTPTGLGIERGVRESGSAGLALVERSKGTYGSALPQIREALRVVFDAEQARLGG